jgi:hypothetical protein
MSDPTTSELRWISDIHPSLRYVWALFAVEEIGCFQSLICVQFPRRICVAAGEPDRYIGPEALFTAGCVFEVAGKLYVVADSALYAAPSSADVVSNRASLDGSHEETKEFVSMKLGTVVLYSTENEMMIIELDRAFATCGISKPIPTIYAGTRNNAGSPYESLYLVTARIAAQEAYRSDTGASYQLDKTCPIANLVRLEGQLGHYSWYHGSTIPTDKLHCTDSGCLVMSNNGFAVGIASIVSPGLSAQNSKPDNAEIDVLLFDEKLWATLRKVSQSSQNTTQTQSQVSKPRIWRHLLYTAATEKGHGDGQNTGGV